MSSSSSSSLDSKYGELDKQLTKKFGPNYVGYTTTRKVASITRVSTGCITLDRVLGGGIPEGCLLEIFGNPSSSKTTICLMVVAAYQKQGRKCLWIDAERAFDPEYASYCGVLVDELAILYPMSAGEALDAIRVVAKSGLVDLVVLDSTAALVPLDDYDKEAGVSTIGSVARLLSQMLKQLVTLCDESKCSVLFINQVRASNMTGYGPKTTTTGGIALEFYSSIRLQVSRTAYLEDASGKVGINVNVQAVKNKTATPWKSGTLDVYYPYMSSSGELLAGVDDIGDVLDNALEAGIIKKGGSWLTYGDAKMQGRDKMRAHLMENPYLVAALKEQLTGQGQGQEVGDSYDSSNINTHNDTNIEDDGTNIKEAEATAL